MEKERMNINLQIEIEQYDDGIDNDEIRLFIDFKGICEDVAEQLLEALMKPEDLDKAINLFNSQLSSSQV